MNTNDFTESTNHDKIILMKPAIFVIALNLIGILAHTDTNLLPNDTNREGLSELSILKAIFPKYDPVTKSTGELYASLVDDYPNGLPASLDDIMESPIPSLPSFYVALIRTKPKFPASSDTYSKRQSADRLYFLFADKSGALKLLWSYGFIENNSPFGRSLKKSASFDFAQYQIAPKERAFGVRRRDPPDGGMHASHDLETLFLFRPVERHNEPILILETSESDASWSNVVSLEQGESSSTKKAKSAVVVIQKTTSNGFFDLLVKGIESETDTNWDKKTKQSKRFQNVYKYDGAKYSKVK